MADIDDVYDLLVKLQPQLQSVFDNVDRRNSSAMETLMASCVAHYKMDDNAASTTVIDSSGNGYNGTAVRNTTLMHAAGKIGGALEFDGESDYIDCGETFQSTFQDSFTLNVWVKFPVLVSSIIFPIFGAYNTGNESGFLISLNKNTNKMQIYYYANGYYNGVSSVSVTNESWEMYSISVEKTSSSTATFNLYKDGVLLLTTTSNLQMSLFDTNGQNAFIGTNNYDGSPGDLTQCSIDNLMLFNKALSADEVALLYNTDNGFALSSDLDDVATDITLLKNIQEGDWYIDKTDATQYQLVVHKKGDPATEYIRKDMKKADGTAITDVSQILAQLTEPT